MSPPFLFAHFIAGTLLEQVHVRLMRIRGSHDKIIKTQRQLAAGLHLIIDVLRELEEILLDLQSDRSDSRRRKLRRTWVLRHDLQGLLCDAHRIRALIAEEADCLLDGPVDLDLDCGVDLSVEVDMITGKARTSGEMMGSVKPKLHHPHEPNILQHH